MRKISTSGTWSYNPCHHPHGTIRHQQNAKSMSYPYHTYTRPHSNTVEAPQKQAASDVRLADMYEVILFNDEENDMETVMDALMEIFAHPAQLALRIMLEAHHRGHAIAEVEEKSEALSHCHQLQQQGLTAEARPL